MTAVAPPPNFPPISRSGWSAPNGNSNGINPMTDDVSRMFMPRRTVQRTPSSNSLSSSSSNGTITATAIATNGMSPSPATDGQNWSGSGIKKKPTRGLWPASEAKPIAGLSNARPQPIASASSGPSAASAISALHSPSSMLPSQQHNGQSQVLQNGQPRTSIQAENTAVLYLIPMNGTFERKTITVPFYPDVLKIGRQTNNKTQPTPLNGYFDSKVLSRQHAEIWADRNGKVWIRDVKSSNGTFVNGDRLSPENRDSEPHELREQDMLELGIDIISEDQKTIVHHKVASRVEHAGFYNTNGQNVLDLNFGDLDQNSNGGLMSPGFGQNMGPMRPRQGSQGSIGNGSRLGSSAGSVAGSNANGMGQRGGQQGFWLQPITMDQVVKKLNAELKAVKVQSQELERATQSVTMMLSNDPKKESSKSPQHSQIAHVKQSPIKPDLKQRFSEPPAPPPQQPLPEKPDAANYLPSLRRNETEKPIPTSSNGSPLKERIDALSPIRTLANPQTAALAEALATAQKNLEAQSVKVKELEQTLEQEKRAREAAEEKALRLEAEQRKETAPQVEEVPEPDITVTITEDSNDDETLVDGLSENTVAEAPVVEEEKPDVILQHRVDTMLTEMSEMRVQMEKFRQRAEIAETDSAKDRATLAEMIEKLRDQQQKDDGSKKGKQLTKRTRRSRTPSKDSTEGVIVNGHITEETLEKEPEDSQELAQEFAEALQQVLAHRRDQDELLANKAPVASMVSIVLIGVGIMAWLNSWPKIER